MLSFLTGNYARIAVYGAIVFTLLAGAAGWGYMKGSERLFTYQVAQAKQAVGVVVKQGAATERVLVQYVKVAGATKTVTQTVEKEVKVYVPSAGASCLDARWGVLHDSAATNTVPEAPRGTDATPGAAEALATVTANYEACTRNADRLTALQAWINAQEKVRP